MEKIEVGDWVQDLWPTELEVCGRGFVVWVDEKKEKLGVLWEDPCAINLDEWEPTPDNIKGMTEGNDLGSLFANWGEPIRSSLIKVDKNRAYDEFKGGEYVSTPDQEYPEGTVSFQRGRLVAVTKGFNSKWTTYFRVEDLKRVEGIEKWHYVLKKYYYAKSWSYCVWKLRRSKGYKRSETWKAFAVPKEKLRNPFVPFWFWKLIERKEEKIEQTI